MGVLTRGLEKLAARFFPEEKNFYRLLTDQAEKTLEGLGALADYAGERTPERADRVRQVEQEADELRRSLVEALHQSFVTPMDREDIYCLSRTVDDIIDYANSTVDETEIYDVCPDNHLREMVAILKKETREICQAIGSLETSLPEAMEHAVLAKSCENAMERAYHQALADLFKKTDTLYMLKMREIYRHMSNAADRGDAAANTICSIVLKAH